MFVKYQGLKLEVAAWSLDATKFHLVTRFFPQGALVATKHEKIDEIILKILAGTRARGRWLEQKEKQRNFENIIYYKIITNCLIRDKLTSEV